MAGQDATEFVWSEEKEDKMIELWRDHVALYDVTHASYHNRVIKRQSLEQISSAVGCDGRVIKMTASSTDTFT